MIMIFLTNLIRTKGNGNKEYHLFAANQEMNSISELKRKVPANRNDIFQFIRCGYDSLCAILKDIFLQSVMEYTENRIEMLRNRLIKS